jgi:phosphoribosylamine--glycine ligase
MWTSSGPKVLEFNTRFGDPETEVLMPLLKDDAAELFAAAVAGRVPDRVDTWERSAAAVVIASGGYPDRYDAGVPIEGLDAVRGDDVAVFHAGTRVQNGRVVTAGGRILAVTAWAPGLPAAVGAAYDAVARLRIAGAFHRRDIGRRHLTASTERTKR